MQPARSLPVSSYQHPGLDPDGTIKETNMSGGPSRRDVLRTGVAVGAGLVLGMPAEWPRRPSKKPWRYFVKWNSL